jgi:GNAT superfamily N-acetyltransferase
VPLSGLVPQILIDILAKMKIFVFPYQLVAEGMTTAESRSVARKFADCEFGALGPQDMPAIASIPGRGFSLEQLLSRLREGQLCFGAKYHGEIVAFTWLNLTEGTIRSHHLFPLKAHEAFLFDAYTLERFRGMGIAPGLHYHCCEELAKLGRDQCYSVTAMWDPSAPA